MAKTVPYSAVVEASILLLQNSPSPMLVFDANLTILFVNAAHSRMTGRSHDEVVGRHIFDAFAPNPDMGDSASARSAMEQAVAEMIATGKSHSIEEEQHDLPDETGEYRQRFWSWVQWPVYEDGRVVAIIQRSEDVTEQVRLRRLIQVEKREAAAISGLAFFSYDPASDHFARSRDIDDMFGFAPGEAGEFATQFFERVIPEDLPGVHAEVERAMAKGPGERAAFDYRVLNPHSETPRFVRVRAGVERDPVDGELKLFGAFVDLTDVELARSQMETLSKRNEALVLESNHRIKNSLAIAAAMLSYQMRATKSTTVKDALQAASTRIMAISDVHGELFADSGVEWVDAGRMLDRFVTSFMRTVDADGHACRIDATMQSVELPSRYAVTLALMLNELLTNAVKYGMADGETGKIAVKMSAENETAQLRVTNPIVGKQFADIASEGVGTELVNAFAQQLNGEIVTTERENEFEVVFQFPLPSDDIVH